MVAVSLCAGGWLLWAWKSLMSWEATFYAALVALLTAVYWGVQYALVTGRLIVNQAGYIKLNSAYAKRAAAGYKRSADGETAGGTSAEQSPAAEPAEMIAAKSESLAEEASPTPQSGAAADGHFERTPANVEDLLGPDATTPGNANRGPLDGSPQ